MNPYVLGGAALVIIVMGWQLKASITRNGELSAKLETQAEQTLEATDANDTNMVTIMELKSTIDSMVEERRVDTERREQVLVEREQELLRARARADDLEREREDEIATNQNCAELTALDVGFFCPATGEQLRQRSRGASSNGDGNG
jgi:hypothetical protein